ncbi:hypothetical protein TUZN_1606 [Thermoproteus uzoniensis 768-20]|uniref:Uncharacterized protein n=1 Tax=Thermoproteus uzoniensis (strain 768-20) TaxID=999630 RepID=F2L2M5_THEU7|nr:hypothetical protein [Thermoproteus uzoniensis]AEA13073.1 hypothetical protein TUZN_1606 [Thermoproteus uzoniensis 768-20]
MRSLIIALAAAAAVAIALYALAPYLTGAGTPQASQTAPPAGSTTSAGASTAASTSTSSASASSTTSETVASTTSQPAAQTSTTATLTSAPTFAGAPRPNITLVLETAVVNTTRLPANATLIFRAENRGEAPGVVYVNGTAVRLRPGEAAELNFTVAVSRAGANYVLLYINGTPAVYRFTTLYYTPVFAAEPVTVRTYRLPALVVVNVTVRNVGNYTGYFNGVAVPPGGNATAQVEINATAAGTYWVKADGVPVEVHVVYLATGYSVAIWSPTVEAAPGEPVPVGFLIKNTGNATEALTVNGTLYVLRPGESVWANYTVPAYSRRPVALIVNGTTWRWALNVSIIAVNALLNIGGGVYNPALSPQIVISSSQSAVPYTWIISTNATERAVALVINGTVYTVQPGGRLLINGTLQARLNDWNTVSVVVNGTAYSIQVYVELKPPTLYVAQITGLSFTDRRTYIEYASCSGTPIGSVPFTATVYSMSGSVTYSGNTITFSGSITVYIDILGKTITASYSGSSTNGVGQVTSTIGHYTIAVSFSGGTVTSVTVNGQPVSCGTSIIPIPAFMYQKPPTGTIDAVSFASRIADLFAKGGSDAIVDAYYNGRYVVLVDASGNTMTYSGGAINGPLQVSIYGQISVS